MPITEYQGHTFDGSYEVSNWGNVRKAGVNTPVAFYNDGYGYKRFKIYDTNHRRTAIRIHRLVALYFIGAPEPGQEVDHIDGNTSNNSYSNLQWVYHRDNMKRKSKAYGEAL